MKRKSLLSAIFMAFSLCTFAQANTCFFNIAQKGAETAMLSIAFDDSPVVTYDYDEATKEAFIVVSANGHEKHAFCLDKQYEITYTDQAVPVGVKEILAKSALNMQGGIAVISGLKANEAVSVYSANGALVANTVADANGIAQVNLSAMPKGIVVIKAGAVAFKVKK